MRQPAGTTMPPLFVGLIVSAAALAETAPAPASAGAVAASRSPNIVLIVADDLGFNSVGYRGGWLRTPEIDRLAARGVSLDRFYVSPMCSPTRAGLMTARYPMRYGMARTVVRPWLRYGLPPAEHTIPELLAEAGYRHRGVFGKWHLGHLSPEWHPLAQGFTAFEGLYNGAADYRTRVRDGEVDWHVDREPRDPQGYTTDLIADAAARFIRQRAAQAPFFCYVPFTSPHDPLQAPPSYVARYANLDDRPGDGRPSDLQVLAAMITCMDDGIGRIMKAIDEAGIANNTLVWFISDNGGLRRFAPANRPLRDGKLTVYEGGVRVPSAAWWPGVIEGGRHVSEPVMNLDILPTLLRAAGRTTPLPGPVDGHDVLDLLAGRSAALPVRDLYFFTGQSGLEQEQIAITSADGWKLVVLGPDIRRPEGFRTPQHTVQLFHLTEDPSESRDLAASHPDRVAELGRRLIAFRNSEPAGAVEPAEKPADFVAPPHWEMNKKT
jgi:arylsulfatase A-like enzyme